MVFLQLKDPLGLFVKSRDFCRGVIKQTKIRRTLPLKDVLADSAWPGKSLELFGNFYHRHFFLPCCC